jgi:ribonuclease-3
MGKGDVEGGVQNEASVKEDLFEAIIGAVAIDSNWNMSILEEIILRLLDVDKVLEEGFPSEPDYEKELNQWFSSHGNVMQVEQIPANFEKLEYGVCIDLGYKMLSHLAYGYGKTLHGARRMAAKRAMAFIGKTSNMAEKIRNAIGNIDPERPINQLQELWQKGIIPKPEYHFSEGKKSPSGNPQWMCSCTIGRIYDPIGEYVCESKAEAKKEAAYEAMLHLVGGVDMARAFVDYGKEIKEEN